MIDSLYVAWRYLSFGKVRTATLVACVTLITFLPLSLNLLLDESERQLLSRADTTPLVLGAKGSALDLMMNTLYFDDEVPQTVSMAGVEELMVTDLVAPIPMYTRFKARDFPIVGTSIDYFDFRNLRIKDGRQLAVLGEAVIGNEVAARLGLQPGDSIVSSPETVFDLAGVYPLKMAVVGVLERTHSADDLAVFVDVKTAWVIQGMGHGHQDLARSGDDSVILDRSAGNIVANAKLVQYNEIDDNNINAFHFHGDAAGYPLTAVIVLPHDDKSGTILRGRYLENSTYQIAKPKDVIEGLMQNIFRIKNMMDGIILVVGLATVAAIVLVFAMSLRLRQREISTITKLGCRRLTIAGLLSAEVVIILLMSGVQCLALMLVTQHYSTHLVRSFFIG